MVRPERFELPAFWFVAIFKAFTGMQWYPSVAMNSGS